MGAIGLEKPIKLFIGFIFSEDVILKDLFSKLESNFGPIESYSDHYDFSHTPYYTKEMGPALKKGFVAFSQLASPAQLSLIKLHTNDIEDFYKHEDKRKVNLDPGIISLHSVVLLSTKDFSHRIPLGEGIYAELTLMFSKNCFKSVPWTYPDFSDESYHDYFLKVRKAFQIQLKETHDT
ncbi:DUF4416 domain-containing protein [Candidatus Marinamargulisbacteria bacterium SCGC AAA071-K20]|nr:DUF4416 domain-containing protein [Candidatus Marinamargulisbacteria bacterium SCGC AAA071-K20]